MRKIAVVAVLFLFFLLVLGAILFKILSPSRPAAAVAPSVQFPIAAAPVGATEQDPVQFVRSFYSWYLHNYYQDHDFPHPENRNEVLSPWLTSDYLANWDQILVEIEVNPVLLTADDPTVWGNAISAHLASQSIRTSVVYVTIGSGQYQHAYNVSLVQAYDGTWKIADVASTI